MRTRIYYPFILLIALLTTVSCENELPFSVKDNPPKLVMNALINADSLTNVSISISREEDTPLCRKSHRGSTC